MTLGLFQFKETSTVRVESVKSPQQDMKSATEWEEMTRPDEVTTHMTSHMTNLPLLNERGQLTNLALGSSCVLIPHAKEVSKHSSQQKRQEGT